MTRTLTRADRMNSLFSRRLIPSARFNIHDAEVQRVREAIRYQEMGLPAPNHDVTDYAGSWERAAEGFRRADPDNVMAFILMSELRYDKGTKPYRALGRLFEQYRKIPEENRTDASTNSRFRDKIIQILADNPVES